MKSKKKKIDPRTENNPDVWAVFFQPALSIPQLETAFTAPVLFSQDGVVMPNEEKQ
jgi:hypothetical protein